MAGRDRTAIEPFYEAIGQRIQARRKELAWSKADLGRLLEPPVSRAYIWNVEKGEQRYPLHIFAQLCARLELDPTTLLKEAQRGESNITEEQEITDAIVESEITNLLAEKLNISQESAASVLSEQSTKRRRGQQ